MKRKQWFMAICVILFSILFTGCPEQQQIITEKIIQIESIPTGMKMTQVFPVIIDRVATGVYGEKSATPQIDFDKGIMYKDNSYNTDGIIHELDLSPIVGKNAVNVFLIIEFVNGYVEEAFNAKFKPANWNVEYNWASMRYNNPPRIISVFTNNEGKINWYHEFNIKFRIDEGFDVDPGYEMYGWMQIRIMCLYYINGTPVNN